MSEQSDKLRMFAETNVTDILLASALEPCPEHAECGVHAGISQRGLINAYLSQAWKLICIEEVEVARAFLRKNAAGTFKQYFPSEAHSPEVEAAVEAAKGFERLASEPEFEQIFRDYQSGAPDTLVGYFYEAKLGPIN